MNEVTFNSCNEEYLLSGEGLVKVFPKKRAIFTGRILTTFTAVDHIDLGIKKGETLGIVGESGCGKSTTGEMLGDLQRPTEGKVFYKGKDIRTMTEAEYSVYRRNVQFIFQDPKGSMNPNASIGEILEEPLLTLHIEPDEAKRKQKAEAMCEAVGLEKSCLKKYPSAISGGQCQRVAIARALITEPELIICDEAVSALDVSVQAQILNLLKSLQEKLHVSYLFISHDIGVVNYMSDRIVVMLDGKIIESGMTEDILHRSDNEYTKSLIESSFAIHE